MIVGRYKNSAVGGPDAHVSEPLGELAEAVKNHRVHGDAPDSDDAILSLGETLGHGPRRRRLRGAVLAPALELEERVEPYRPAAGAPLPGRN